MPHARAAALAAAPGGDQQRVLSRATSRRPRVAAGPAAGSLPLHQHRARPRLRHLCGPAHPTRHLDRALSGRPAPAGEGALRGREEHTPSVGGETEAACVIDALAFIWAMLNWSYEYEMGVSEVFEISEWYCK